MNQYVYEVEEGKGLSEVISRFQRARKKEDRHLLISIFHGSNDRKIIAEDLALLKEAFPGAEMAGMSSSGGIMNGHMVLGRSVVSFSAFQDTEVKVFSYDISAMTPAEAGERALETFSKIPHLSGIEIFTTLSTVDVDDFLTALDNLPPSAAVFGGGADTYTGGDDTCVFGNGFISPKAIVAVCFAGKVKIHVYQNLGWQPLGKAMTITATDGDKVIQELDGKPAIHVYEKYLKINKSDFGGQQLMSFPLLILRNGRMLARLPAACREDGSLMMTSNCFAGEEARLAYGDPNEIIERCQANTKEIRQFSPEGITIFSCITRRLFLKEDTNQVLAPYGEIAPVCGGYSHGEISRLHGKTEALNMTLVAAVFREREGNGDSGRDPSSIVFQSGSMTTIQRLASFITVSTAELEKTNALLAEANRKLSYVAAHDGLTGLLNRESIESILHRLVWERRKDRIDFSAIMIDLDDFKSINDIHGHSEGDRVLKEVSSIFMDEIKPPRKAGRWGGDEFVILLPDTGEDEAFALAERLKKEFQRLVKCGGKSVSASFGVTSSKEGETFDSFYRKMDTALYHAKFKGKNRIFII